MGRSCCRVLEYAHRPLDPWEILCIRQWQCCVVAGYSGSVLPSGPKWKMHSHLTGKIHARQARKLSNGRWPEPQSETWPAAQEGRTDDSEARPTPHFSPRSCAWLQSHDDDQLNFRVQLTELKYSLSLGRCLIFHVQQRHRMSLEGYNATRATLVEAAAAANS